MKRADRFALGIVCPVCKTAVGVNCAVIRGLAHPLRTAVAKRDAGERLNAADRLALSGAFETDVPQTRPGTREGRYAIRDALEAVDKLERREKIDAAPAEAIRAVCALAGRADAYAGAAAAAAAEVIVLRAIAKTSRELEDAAEHYWSVRYPDQPSTRRAGDDDPAVVGALSRLSTARSKNDQALHAWEWHWGRA